MQLFIFLNHISLKMLSGEIQNELSWEIHVEISIIT